MSRATRLLLAMLVASGCGRSGMPFDEDEDTGPRFPLPLDPGGVTPIETPSPTPTPPPFDNGNGQDGVLVVSGDTVVNLCLPVTTASTTGATLPSTAGITAGERVLFHQSQDGTATPGDPLPVASAGEAGSWELARVASVTGTTLTLDASLVRVFGSNATGTAQVCTVPEYTDLSIPAAGAVLRPPAWNGGSGGILALFATGTLDVEGLVVANGRGFRGGGATGLTASQNVVAFDTNTGDGAGKGEGLDVLSLSRSGKGNYFNAAGGGNGNEAGGGGGGNGGAGGFGGSQTEQISRNTNCRGLPGAAVAIADTVPRLVMGGGGGGGHRDDANGDGIGGLGGGIVLLFVNELRGSGTISSNGTDGTSSVANAAGGGGAAGTIVIRVSSASSFTGTVGALGGLGGNDTDATDVCRGPGGGGGGGRAYLAGVTPGVIAVLGGVNGTCVGSGLGAFDATPGDAGVVSTWDLPW